MGANGWRRDLASPASADPPGICSIAAGTRTVRWVELGADFDAAGLRQLIAFNCHGGQASLAVPAPPAGHRA
jgi:creatinine amidohydrolase/Fe(II)-dependent formamide hydrolase-like protein